jgi:hypothetical protein
VDNVGARGRPRRNAKPCYPGAKARSRFIPKISINSRLQLGQSQIKVSNRYPALMQPQN